MYVFMYMCSYIYIYIKREREREREMYICPMEWSDLHVEMEWNGTNLTE